MKLKPTLMRGSYRVQVLEDESIVFDSGEFDNLITDAALEDPGPFQQQVNGFAGVFYLHLCLGAGVVTTPAYSDTDLGNQIATKASGDFKVFTRESAAGVYPAIYKCEREVEFTNISGDLSELGIRKGGSTGTLMSRSLIKDGSGNPITITVTDNQTVRVTYTLYSIIPDEVLGSGTVSTPHGDLSYTVYAADSNNTTAEGIHAFGFAQPMFGSSSYNGGSYYLIGGGYSRSGSSAVGTPYSFDGASNQVTVRISFDYLENDQSPERVQVSYSSFSNSSSRKVPRIEIDPGFTLPANYNLELDLTFTWGRYDSGA